MSLVIPKPPVAEAKDELRRLLAAEFSHPTPGYVQPLISITRPGERTHITVIWDGWKTLSQAERSALIMDAYEEAAGREAALGISVAMGLTSAEAERLGFDFIPAQT